MVGHRSVFDKEHYSDTLGSYAGVHAQKECWAAATRRGRAAVQANLSTRLTNFFQGHRRSGSGDVACDVRRHLFLMPVGRTNLREELEKRLNQAAVCRR